MIKLNVMYPHKDGARFDHTYDRDKHMPMVKAKVGESLAARRPSRTRPFGPS